MKSGSSELLLRGIELTVDDVRREHVSCVRVWVAKEVGEAHGREGIVIVEEAFIEFDHDPDRNLCMYPWVLYIPRRIVMAPTPNCGDAIRGKGRAKPSST